MGVWIEIKPEAFDRPQDAVTPFMGVWIEICNQHYCWRRACVTPFMGVWIEIKFAKSTSPSSAPSHPLWVCGLKCHVDGHAGQSVFVTPFMGVWIENDLY